MNLFIASKYIYREKVVLHVWMIVIASHMLKVSFYVYVLAV